MDKQDKPRICEVLGVEVGEQFKVESDTCVLYVDAYVSEDGTVRTKSITPMDTMRLCQIINGELRIIRQPHFTEDEVATMRVLYAAGFIRVFKFDDGWIRLDSKDFGGNLPPSMFPSIRPGTSVELAAVLDDKG